MQKKQKEYNVFKEANVVLNGWEWGAGHSGLADKYSIVNMSLQTLHENSNVIPASMSKNHQILLYHIFSHIKKMSAQGIFQDISEGKELLLC